MFNDFDDMVNPEILDKIDKSLRRYSFESKLEILRRVAHFISPTLPNKDLKFNLFPDASPALCDKVRETCHLFEIDYLSLRSTILREWDGPKSELRTLKDFAHLVNLLKSYVTPFIHQNDYTNVSLSGASE